jgi:predicted nucleotidyltransferase
MARLPDSATQASLTRFRIAQELVEKSPPGLGREVWLSGSVARGFADHDSDVEVSFLVDGLPSPSRRRRWLEKAGVIGWLERIGAVEIIPDSGPVAEGTIWVAFRFGGVWIEAGWQSVPWRTKLLREILAAKVTDHDRLRMAWSYARRYRCAQWGSWLGGKETCPHIQMRFSANSS